MKKQIQKSILKCLGVVGKVFKNNGNIILCYHSIDSSNWEFSTSVSNFEKQIAYLKNNYELVSINELVKNNSKNRQAAITFDDGYTSFVKNALPIIRKYKAPSTLFVLGSSIKKRNNGTNPKLSLLSEDEIKKLKTDNVTIGYHSENHKDLSKMDLDELETEIHSSKVLFEEKLGIKIDYFAYPFGKYNKTVLSVLRKSGYKAAFTTKSSTLDRKNILEIPRYCVGNNISLNEFQTLITPLGLAYSRLLFFLYNIRKGI